MRDKIGKDADRIWHSLVERSKDIGWSADNHGVTIIVYCTGQGKHGTDCIWQKAHFIYDDGCLSMVKTKI